MFIKEVKKRNSKKGKVFLQYHLIQSLRVEGKPRQRIILYLGYHQFLEDKEKRKIIAKILENKIYERTTLFPPTNDKVLIALVNQYHEKYKIKYNELDTEMHFSKPPTAQTADIHAAKIHSFEVVNSRTLGAERLCYGVLKRLKLDKFLAEKELSSLQIDRAFISIISRAIFASSEHKTAQYLELSSSLNELFNKNYDEIETLCNIMRDENNNIIDPLHRTLPYLSKYERTRVLGQRAKQLNSGSKPFVPVPDSILDGYIIAEMELLQKRIPFIIQRPLHGGACEYWKLRDLEIL